MPPKFYLQSGYNGKETATILFSYEKEEISHSARDKYVDLQVPVGSVEFVEKFIGQRKPFYYPTFLQDWFKREIWYSDTSPSRECFIKPADSHKRFDATICYVGMGAKTCSLEQEDCGPFWCSDVVSFKEEWRYYVANGKILAAYWYLGEEKEIDPPELNVQWPKYFCGAVDFGRLSTGEIALVENNLPYGCGWYGPYSEGKVYGRWLEEGFEFLRI